MKTKRIVELNKPINHIAFIMDGNGRWAIKRALPRTIGHREAMKRIKPLLYECKAYNIKVVSLYAFSTENWKRPMKEIMCLFGYLRDFFVKEIDELESNGFKIVISGDISRLPEETQEACRNAIERTKKNDECIVNICLNYGGRDEIIRATKLMYKDIQDGKLTADDITKENFENYLYTAGLPNVDLMIRTSGEQRLSNYLIWQNSYAEFIFTPVSWPDFDIDAFLDCLDSYNGRKRRFGGLDNEKDRS